jgi:hypothetical protein
MNRRSPPTTIETPSAEPEIFSEPPQLSVSFGLTVSPIGCNDKTLRCIDSYYRSAHWNELGLFVSTPVCWLLNVTVESHFEDTPRNIIRGSPRIKMPDPPNASRGSRGLRVWSFERVWFRLPRSPSVCHAQPAEQIQQHQNNQNYPDNPDATSRSPRSVSVIASASPKYKQQNNKQQNQCHGDLLKRKFLVFCRRYSYLPVH